MNAVLVIVLLQGAAAAQEVATPSEAPETPASVATADSVVEYRTGSGLHLGLNATLTVDRQFGELFYGAFTTQLTGVGNAFAPREGFVLSGLLMGGVALPLRERPGHRLTLDVGPHVTLLRSAPVNMAAVGALAGLRMVWTNGLTLALKLPLGGYLGSLDQPRGSVVQYYAAAVATVPVLSVGYTFRD